MHFLRRIFIVGVASAAMLFSGGPVMAHIFNGAENMVFPDSHSYSGAWPVTITGSEFSNGTDCLTLTQRGSSGGSASLVADGEKYPYGSFLVSQRHPRSDDPQNPCTVRTVPCCSSRTPAAATSARASSKMTEAGRILTPGPCRLA